MAVLQVDQYLNAPLERVFAFFSDAQNLERLTPPFLNFRVLTPGPIVMREGLMIDYQLRLHGLPIRWRSRIAAWEPGVRFVDEQVRGPYRAWVHEHTFRRETRDSIEGTRVRDRVNYEVPGGALVARWFVRPQLDKIFAYRCEAMERIVREWNASA